MNKCNGDTDVCGATACRELPEQERKLLCETRDGQYNPSFPTGHRVRMPYDDI